MQSVLHIYQWQVASPLNVPMRNKYIDICYFLLLLLFVLCALRSMRSIDSESPIIISVSINEPRRHKIIASECNLICSLDGNAFQRILYTYYANDANTIRFVSHFIWNISKRNHTTTSNTCVYTNCPIVAFVSFFECPQTINVNLWPFFFFFLSPDLIAVQRAVSDRRIFCCWLFRLR